MKKASALGPWLAAAVAALMLLGLWAPQKVLALDAPAPADRVEAIVPLASPPTPASGGLSIAIDAFTSGQLEAAVAAKLTGGQQYSDITTLIISGGGNTMEVADCLFIRTEMAATLQTLNMETVSFSTSKIPDSAFVGCTALEAVTLPSLASQMGDDVFSGCTSLAEIVIPDNLSDVGNRAFQGCTSLIRAVMGSNTSIIGVSAFSGCTSLSQVVLGSNTTSINNNAFENCTSLTSFDTGLSLTSMGAGALKGCTGLTSFHCGPAFNNLGTRVFEGCTSLTTITADAGSGYIAEDNVLYSKFPAKERLLQYPLGSSATVFRLPSAVVEVSSYAFAQSPSLKEVWLGAGVTTIKNGAFQDCPQLDTVCMLGTTPPTTLGTNLFQGISPSAVLHLRPAATGYEASALASYFSEIKYDILQFTFHLAGGLYQGSTSDVQLLDIRDRIVPPTVTNPGFMFGGWYSDAGYTTPAPFPNTTVTADSDFYAQWGLTVTPFGINISVNANQVTITFTVAMDAAPGATTVNNGVTLGTPSWSNGGKTITYPITSGKLAANTTYTISLSGFKTALAEAVGSYSSVFTTGDGYEIALNRTGSYDFGFKKEGYPAQTPLIVTLTNTGVQPVSSFVVSLSGQAAAFTVTQAQAASLSGGASTTFTVVPATGLAVGSYTATVTVTGSNGTTASFEVTFEVRANTAPTPIGPNSSVTVAVGNVVTLQAATIAQDADSDSLTIASLTTPPNTAIATVQLNGGQLKVSGVKPGTTAVTVEVSDGAATVPVTVTIQVVDGPPAPAPGGTSGGNTTTVVATAAATTTGRSPQTGDDAQLGLWLALLAAALLLGCVALWRLTQLKKHSQRRNRQNRWGNGNYPHNAAK